MYVIESCDVNKEVKSENGWTALHLACRDGHLEIVKYMIESCDVNSYTIVRTTAMDDAISYSEYDIWSVEDCQVLSGSSAMSQSLFVRYEFVP